MLADELEQLDLTGTDPSLVAELTLRLTRAMADS